MGFLWAEIGWRLTVRVPQAFIGLACCVGGAVCLAYRSALCSSLQETCYFSRGRALSPPFPDRASFLPPTRSKYYNDAAKLIEDTPVQPLSEYLRILSWEGSGKIFAVFRAKIRCDKPMMMRSGGVSRSGMQPILGKVHQLPEALQWFWGWVWGKPREAVNRVSSMGCDEGIVTLAQKIERIPERSLGSYWSPSLEHSAMVPFQLCDGDVCAHVSFEGLDFSGAATTIRSETALVPQPPGVQSKDNLQASMYMHTQAHAHTRTHVRTHALQHAHTRNSKSDHCKT